MKAKILTKDRRYAFELLRSGDRYLRRFYTSTGTEWCIAPGGAIPDSVALWLLEQPQIQPSEDGLWRDCSQTFRFRKSRDCVR